MSKIIDLIQFDEVKIEKKKDLESYIYRATLRKQVVFQLLDKNNLITLEEFETGSKQFIILGILSGKILEECDADDTEYFTELKNQMESMPQEVDDYLWSIGLKRKN
jgi:predicted RNA-binding protein